MYRTGKEERRTFYSFGSTKVGDFSTEKLENYM